MKNKTVDQVIEHERQVAVEKTKSIQEKLKQDNEQMKVLQNEYTLAVFEADPERIDRVNDQIKALSESIQQGRDVVEILSDHHNPAIQRAVIDAIEQWEARKDELRNKATSIYKELLPHHKKLVAGLTELNAIRQQVFSLDNAITQKATMLNPETRKELGIHASYGGLLCEIRRYMDPLLIRQYPDPTR